MYSCTALFLMTICFVIVCLFFFIFLDTFKTWDDAWSHHSLRISTLQYFSFAESFGSDSRFTPFFQLHSGYDESDFGPICILYFYKWSVDPHSFFADLDPASFKCGSESSLNKFVKNYPIKCVLELKKT